MAAQLAARRQQLGAFVDAEAESLLKILRLYVIRAGLAHYTAADAVAADLLTEVVAEALEHVDRLHTPTGTKAWLLGIATNLIRRRQARRAQLDRREPLIRDLHNPSEPISDDDLFDRFVALMGRDPEDTLEKNEQVTHILSIVSDSDRRVLELAILHELDGEALARELGTTRGAAYVRVHRALARLRKAFEREGHDD